MHFISTIVGCGVGAWQNYLGCIVNSEHADYMRGGQSSENQWDKASNEANGGWT